MIESFCKGTGMWGSSVLSAHFVCVNSILMKFFYISNFSFSLSWLISRENLSLSLSQIIVYIY